MAKDFLSQHCIPYTTVSMNQEEDPEGYVTMRDELVSNTGQNTFPFIYIGDVFLGGYTELVNAYDTLKLHDLCTRAGFNLDMDF